MKIIFLIIMTILFSGCATTKRSSVAFRKDTGGSLSVWNAEMSAAIAYNNGKMCMQPALVAKTTNVDVDLKVSEALLNLTKAQLIASDKGASNLADLGVNIKQALAVLTASTERTTFLSSGLFYLCQLGANGLVSQQDMNAEIGKLIEESARIPSTASTSQTEPVSPPVPTHPAVPAPATADASVH